MSTKQLDDQDMLILRGVDQRQTYREMADAIQRATSVAYYRVQALEEAGLVVTSGNKARMVKLTPEGESILRSTGAPRPF